MDNEIKASVRALAHNIGFKWLCKRLTSQRADLEKAIFSAHYENVHEYYALQAKINALRFMEVEVARAVNVAKLPEQPEFKFTEHPGPDQLLNDIQTAREALPLEREKAAFAAATKNIELVGA